MARRITVHCPHCGETFRPTVPEPQTRRVNEINLVRRSNGSFTIERDSTAITLLDGAKQFGIGDKILGGLLVSTCGLAMTALVSATLPPEVPPEVIAAVALSGGPIAAGAYWLWDFRIASPDFARWYRNAKERIDMPMNEIEPPPATPPKIDLVVQRDEPNRPSWFQRWRLDVRQDGFDAWVIAALQGQSLAYAQWTGGGRPFTRNEYDSLTARMTQAGIISKGGKGTELTTTGQGALWRYVRERKLTV